MSLLSFVTRERFLRIARFYSKAHSVVMIPAQSKLHADELSGYVFSIIARLTADPEARVVYLGRPWRADLVSGFHEH